MQVRTWSSLTVGRYAVLTQTLMSETPVRMTTSLSETVESMRDSVRADPQPGVKDCVNPASARGLRGGDSRGVGRLMGWGWNTAEGIQGRKLRMPSLRQ
jgi:hypothetical protein